LRKKPDPKKFATHSPFNGEELKNLKIPGYILYNTAEGGSVKWFSPLTIPGPELIN
jgi:hypothetical protein